MGAIETVVIDSGDKHDGCGRKISSAERRAEAVREYRASGSTMAAFARREGVKYSTFVGWVQKRRPRGSGGAPPVRFAEVRLPVPLPSAPAPGLEVRLVDGTMIRGSVAAEVAALVRALRT